MILPAGILLALLFIAIPALSAEPITWPEALYNPQPLAGDIVLPLPCGGAMAFRAIPTPGHDSGYPVVGPFAGADATPYLLFGKYEVSDLQAQALVAGASGQACPQPKPALQAPTLINWWEAVELGDRASVWLANKAEDLPPCDPGATPCLPRVDGVAAYLRLPTAAEWEYAARGGLSVPAGAFAAPRYPMAEGIGAHAWYGANSRGAPQPIGGLAASPLGLHDLYGNAAEWALESGLAPVGAPPPFAALALGGHIGSPEGDLRADWRWVYPPFATDPAARAGLRLLASVPLFTSPEKVREAERRRLAQRAPMAEAQAPQTEPEPPPPPVWFFGSLRVTADAPGEVLVDGQIVGRVEPRQVFESQTVEVGERRIEVRAQGYQAPVQTHGFRTRQWVEADFRLTAVTPPKPAVIEPTPTPVAEAPSPAAHALPPLPEMIALPGGEFWMGSPDGEPERSNDEGPRYKVPVAPFAIGKTEVTFAQYDAFAQATGRAKPEDMGWGRGDRPVINVSWEDAVAYAIWLSKETGAKYRLPSEAEWEYAARAGTEDAYWWGQGSAQGNANCNGCGGQWGGRQMAPVGSFKANPWGLYDTAGNVWEWVQDPYHDSYKGAPADGSVWEPGGSSARVVRGGSWDNFPRNLRAADRDRYEPGIRGSNLGFRLARTAGGESGTPGTTGGLVPGVSTVPRENSQPVVETRPETDGPTPSASEAIEIKAPDVAENGAVVAVTVAVTGEKVKEISLYSGDLSRLALKAELSPQADPYLATRVKLVETGPVIVIVVTTDGRRLRTEKRIKITGGAGPGKDTATALDIKLRGQGDTIKMLLAAAMGPDSYVSRLTVSSGKDWLARVEVTPWISTNPYFSFNSTLLLSPLAREAEQPCRTHTLSH